jgi:hypothetical protein
MEWRVIKLLHVWKDPKRKIRWKTIPTFVEALRVDGDKIDG